MVQELRQSTAVTVPYGPFVDATDAVTPETALTIQKAHVRIKKNGGDMAAASADQGSADAGAPHDEIGVYDGSLNTTDTNTLGRLRLDIQKAGAAPWFQEFQVITAEEWDARYSTGIRQSNVTQISGDATAADNAEAFFDGTGYAGTGNVIPTVTNLTNAPTNGDLTATMKASINTEVDAALDTAIPGSPTANSVNERLQTMDNAYTATRAGYLDNLSAGAVALASSLATLAGKFTGITLLSEWLGLIAGKQVGNTTARTELRASGAGSGTYDETTDSLEALRDAGSTPAEVATATMEKLIADHSSVSGSVAERLSRLPNVAAGGNGGLPTVNGSNYIAGMQGTINTLDALDTAQDAQHATTQGKVDTVDDLLDTEIAAIISSLATIAGYIDTEVAAIKAKTDALPSDPADASDVAAAIVAARDVITALLPSALTAGGNMKSDSLAINGSTAAAVRQALAAGTIIPGTVDHTGAASTTTEFEADDITEATADHYNGRVILFTSGAMLGQATSITDYTLVGGRGHFTVPALTEAPADNVTFIII